MSVFLQWWDRTILQPSIVIGCSIHKGREDYCVKSAMHFRRSISLSGDYFGPEFLTSISLLPCKLQLVHSEQKMNSKLARLSVAQKLMVFDIAHLVTVLAENVLKPRMLPLCSLHPVTPVFPMWLSRVHITRLHLCYILCHLSCFCSMSILASKPPGSSLY